MARYAAKMDTSTVQRAFAEILVERRLLDHPFYRRWEAGGLQAGELARYAEEYRHLEKMLPSVLAQTASGLPAGPARALVEESLHDELAVPEPHVELFESFAIAAGAGESATPGAAAQRLTELQRQAAASQPVAALAMIALYEVQAAEIARTKSDGLREHYGFDPTGTRFWDVHATMETQHAQWSLEALASLDPAVDEITEAAGAAADAWWGFLDERELAAVG
jgi:pyrroloquinoline quinone (PQQ) biosynthesis protein C